MANDSLLKHISSIHEREKTNICKICEFKSANKYYLKKHVATVHEGIKPFKCCECDSEYAQNTILWDTFWIGKSLVINVIYFLTSFT